MSNAGKATVFVGNIPYDATEEDLRSIFATVGGADSLRLVYDKETRQPRGYAFCDFPDRESAQSAIVALSEVECNGRRLRLDLADNALRGGGGGGGFRGIGAPGPLALALPGHSPSFGGASSSRPPPGSSLPSLPGSTGGPTGLPGGPPAPTVGPAPIAPPMPSGVVHAKSAGLPGQKQDGGDPSAGDAAAAAAAGADPDAVIAAVTARADIAQAVAAMPQAQLQVCLASMQRLAVEDPESSRALLQDNPQLCHALLHAQLLLGLNLDPSLPPSEEEVLRLRTESLRAKGVLPPPPPPMFAGMPNMGQPGFGGFGGSPLPPGIVPPPGAGAFGPGAGFGPCGGCGPYGGGQRHMPRTVRPPGFRGGFIGGFGGGFGGGCGGGGTPPFGGGGPGPMMM